jgi:hypothetical protein
MFGRAYWGRAEVKQRIAVLEAKADGTMNGAIRRRYEREIAALRKAREWKCQHCGTTIDQLLKRGLTPWNLFAKYCPQDCAGDAKAEKQRQRRAEKREQARASE